VAQKMKLDSLGEELRVLYVAMTRAREKLILTGMIKKPVSEEGTVGRLSFLKIATAKSYLGWLLPVIMGATDTGLFAVRRVTPGQLLAGETVDRVVQMARRRQLAEAIMRGGEPITGTDPTAPPTIDNEMAGGAIERERAALAERFARRYPHEHLARLYSKTTVSELKKATPAAYTSPGEVSSDVFRQRLYEEPEVVPYIPLFMKEQEDITGTVRGSAYHKVMELMDFRAILMAEGTGRSEAMERGERSDVTEKADRLEAIIREQLERAVAGGRLSVEYKEAVRLERIADFMRTPLAQRMMIADRVGQLKKEQPFVLGFSADRLEEGFSAEETIMVEGIIDVFFEEEGMLVVMDYKTDAVKRPEELEERYKKQLDYYAEALERLTGKRVKERVIYSFALAREIVL
jgi:ATP-dependent helicase/nuclease subunit A